MFVRSFGPHERQRKSARSCKPQGETHHGTYAGNPHPKLSGQNPALANRQSTGSKWETRGDRKHCPQSDSVFLITVCGQCLLTFHGFPSRFTIRRSCSEQRLGSCLSQYDIASWSNLWTTGDTKKNATTTADLREGEGTADWDTAASNRSTGNRLSNFNRRINSNSSNL